MNQHNFKIGERFLIKNLEYNSIWNNKNTEVYDLSSERCYIMLIDNKSITTSFSLTDTKLITNHFQFNQRILLFENE
jgi:hypothetical protein